VQVHEALHGLRVGGEGKRDAPEEDEHGEREGAPGLHRVVSTGEERGVDGADFGADFIGALGAA
jgi:hypothetical protein